MRCSDSMDWVAQGLDGSLPPDRADELDRHIAGCARCRAEYALQARIGSALRETGPGCLPGDFTERVIRNALAAGPVRRRFRCPRVLVPAASFAAVAAALLLAGAGVGRLAGAAEPSSWFEPLARIARFVVTGFDAFPALLGGLLGDYGGLVPAPGHAIPLAAVSVLAAVWGLREVLDYLGE